MKKYLLYIVFILFPIAGFAQVVRQGDSFVEVSEIEGKVTFLKEIASKNSVSQDANYKILKDWAIINYGKDPFISSVRHDTQNKEFIAKSRIELLLPANSKGVREKMIMRYRINGFIFQDKCVLEITGISYLYENAKNDKLLPRVIRAEDFITDKAIEVDDNLKEFRVNTRKSTLFFLNQIAEDFERKFGY
ncbi:DUF4468 domain-containing protein [Dysgonomonas sp. Marseille-P4677]|uniref:DUF4468 domain-containing protein n=1 Tax=Dysgonomonas sp. Marseille-P4677 TaxID=2364790 RepID=UPI0019125CC5|nr:DUF4468 domain-containing protein [Dysgonomonas sp. Marseille-P4677]MBK5720060.1 DUF4468 domain-containing protein [Dysgonomonas sp. Marseille-P4677]